MHNSDETLAAGVSAAGTRMIIKTGGKTITLIGTAHVSKESIEEVRRSIESPESGEIPDMICVELDQGRYNTMQNSNAWEKLDVGKLIKEGKGFLLIANLVLAGFQRRLGKELGVKPGEEMKAAIETAEKLGISHALCDREVQITLQRAWSKCGLWDKSKLLASLLSSAFTKEKLSSKEIEDMKKHSELDGMMTELAAYLPAVKETLIDERDRYLAAKIWSAGASRPLAVVGAGHMAGIKVHLEKIAAGEETTLVDDLDKIIPPGIVSRILPWIIPVLIMGLVAYTAYKFKTGEGFITWILLNGGLAALGTLFALGHPLSILVSFIGAPIATINPVIGVGLFSGFTEVSLRKPRVEDAASINDDISSIKGIYRNRITRALLVFLLSSIGGIAGNAIAMAMLAASGFNS